MVNKPFVYICTLMSVPERIENVKNKIIPFLEENNYKIWPAIDGVTEDLEKFLSQHSDIKIDLNKFEHSDNYVACPRTALALVCSTIAILEDALKMEYDSVVFFEDDAQLNEGFYEKLNLMVSELPSEPCFLKFYSKFGLNSRLNIKGKHYIKYFPKSCFNSECWGTDCLYFNKKGVRIILENLKKTAYVLDHFFAHVYREGLIQGFLCKVNYICKHTPNSLPSKNCKGCTRKPCPQEPLSNLYKYFKKDKD